MSTTQVSDIVEPSVFTPYAQEKTKELSGLWESEIIVPDAEIQKLAAAGGSSIDMPFWNDLGNQESNTGSDDPASKSSPEKITAGQDIARMLFRNQSWSSMDLAKVIAGEDPAEAIAMLVGGYWSRDHQRTVIAMLNGVFADNAANNGGDMISDIATDGVGAPTDLELIGENQIVDALGTMGDAMEDIVAMGMHSVPYNRLIKRDLIEFKEPSSGTTKIPHYLGRRLLVDDGCPAEAGVNRITYTTFMFKRGAIGSGDGNPKTPTEVERDAAAGDGEGQETLHSRRHLILHPRGVKFTTNTMAGKSATNTELALPANWSRVYERKNVGLVALKTNG